MRENVHIAYVGTSGSGKTTLMNRHILEEADRGFTGEPGHTSGIAVFYPHADAAERLLLHLEERGHLWRTLVIDLREVNKVLPVAMLRSSNDPNYWQAMKENRAYRVKFNRQVWRHRGEDKPMVSFTTIDKASDIVCGVYQYLDEWIPPVLLGQILEQDSDVQKWALQHCTHAGFRRKLAGLASLPDREQLMQVWPTIRMYDNYYDCFPIFARSCVHSTFNPTHWLRHGGIIIWIGGEDPDAITTVMGSDYDQLCSDILAEHCPDPIYIYMDELSNYDILSKNDGRNAATMRHHNGFLRFGVQEKGEDPEVWRKLWNNLNGKYIFRPNDQDSAEDQSRDLVAMLDRMKTHHIQERRRQVHDDFIEVERVSVASGKGDDSSWTSRTVGSAPVAQYREEVEETPVYEDFKNQILWRSRDLRIQPDMHYFRMFKNEMPTQGVVRWLPDTCNFKEQYPAEVRRCLEVVMSRDIYKSPEQPRLPNGPASLNSTPKNMH